MTPMIPSSSHTTDRSNGERMRTTNNLSTKLALQALDEAFLFFGCVAAPAVVGGSLRVVYLWLWLRRVRGMQRSVALVD